LENGPQEWLGATHAGIEECRALPEPERPPLYPATPKLAISEELADIESALTTVASEIGTARANRKPVHVIVFSPSC